MCINYPWVVCHGFYSVTLSYIGYVIFYWRHGTRLEKGGFIDMYIKRHVEIPKEKNNWSRLYKLGYHDISVQAAAIIVSYTIS